MATALHNFEDRERSSGSGIHRVLRVPEIMRFKKDNFERVLLDLEEDAILKNLVNMPAHGRAKTAGTLRILVEELRDFEEKYLGNDEKFFDLPGQTKDLEEVYKKVLNKVVADWPELIAQGVDWYQLNSAISGHMLRVAGVFGLSGEMNAAIQDWGSKYTKNEERKHQLRQREMLNAEALNAHGKLAFLSTHGKSSDKVIEETRHYINQIDQQLRKLPVDPEALPAFSVVNSQHSQFQPKVILNTPNKVSGGYSATYAKTLLQQNEPAKQETKKVSGWRAAAKKIPLLGRFF